MIHWKANHAARGLWPRIAEREGEIVEADLSDLASLLRQGRHNERREMVRMLFRAIHDVLALRKALGLESRVTLELGPRGGMEHAVLRGPAGEIVDLLHALSRPQALQPDELEHMLQAEILAARPAGHGRPSRRPYILPVPGCGDGSEVHRIRWAPGGPIALLDHSRDEIRAWRILEAMGHDRESLPPCLGAFRAIREELGAIGYPTRENPKSETEKMGAEAARRREEKKIHRARAFPLLARIMALPDPGRRAEFLAVAHARALGFHNVKAQAVKRLTYPWASISFEHEVRVHRSILALAMRGIRADGHCIPLGVSRWGPEWISIIWHDLLRGKHFIETRRSPFLRARPMIFSDIESWASWPRGRKGGTRITIQYQGDPREVIDLLKSLIAVGHRVAVLQLSMDDLVSFVIEVAPSDTRVDLRVLEEMSPRWHVRFRKI